MEEVHAAVAALKSARATVAAELERVTGELDRIDRALAVLDDGMLTWTPGDDPVLPEVPESAYAPGATPLAPIRRNGRGVQHPNPPEGFGEKKPPSTFDNCGTLGGFMRHRKAGERACRPCMDANRDYRREYQAKKQRNGVTVAQAAELIESGVR